MGDESVYETQKKGSFHEVHGGNGRVKDVERVGLGVRHLQTVLMAAGSFMAYSLRTNLSVAIVAMVREKGQAENFTLTDVHGGNFTLTDVHDGNFTLTDPPTYDWDEETKGYVLGSFFCGYLITQIPAGILTERFGGHSFLCGAIFFASMLTLLMPQCAYIGGWQLVCANRIGQGISQGFVFPSIFTLLGVWAPFDERGRLASLSLGAQLLGTVASTPLSGLLSSVYGWPTVFYCFGVFGIVVATIMYFSGADTPAKHRLISQDEKHFIQSSLGGAKVKLKVPWRLVFTCVPIWSAIIAMSVASMVFLTFLMVIPTYLGTVLKFNIKENGVVSALPFLVSWLMTFGFSWSSDYLIARGYLGLTAARKILNSFATFGAGLCMGLMAFTNDAMMSVFLLTSSFALQAACYAGVQATFVDLVPNFAGPVFSIGNFLSACLGLCGPIIVGFIVTEAGSGEQWRIVLLLNGALLMLSNVIFIIWGTSDTLWWNWPNDNEEKIGPKGKEKSGALLKVDT